MRTTLKCTNTDEDQLKQLEKYRRKTFVDVLRKTHQKVSEQLYKLKKIQSVKVKEPDNIETKMFKVLKRIGVELCSYHSGSLNGKGIKKVMNNTTYIFDQLALIFQEGKRPSCLLSNPDIAALCLHFRGVFVLWDGMFLVVRTINPDKADISTYRKYVMAAVQGHHTDLKCTITPEV
jgi:hypothetical protein